MSITQSLRAEIDRINQQPCQCVRCDFCRGTGTYWADIRSGMPSNDCSHLFDELETCDQCHGGIIDVCDRCRESEELYQQLEEIEERDARKRATN